MKKIRIVLVMQLVIIFGVLGVAGKVSAEERNVLDIEKKCSISMNLPTEYSELKKENIRINLYKVANISETWQFNVISGYEAMNNCKYNTVDESGKTVISSISLNYVTSYTTASQWKVLTDEAVRISEKKQPNSTGIMKNGEIKFDNLSVGLYLIETDKIAKDNKEYGFMSYLISVPGYQVEVKENQMPTNKNHISENEKQNPGAGNQMSTSEYWAGSMQEGVFIYDVKTELKIEVKSTETNIEETTTAPVIYKIIDGVTRSNKEIRVDAKQKLKKLPQTGQLKWVIPLFVSMGLGFVSLGAFFASKDKKGE